MTNEWTLNWSKMWLVITLHTLIYKAATADGQGRVIPSTNIPYKLPTQPLCSVYVIQYDLYVWNMVYTMHSKTRTGFTDSCLLSTSMEENQNKYIKFLAPNDWERLEGIVYFLPKHWFLIFLYLFR